MINRNYKYYKISTSDIAKSIQTLKTNKRDGSRPLVTNNFIHCDQTTVKLLADLFTSIILHGYCPKDKVKGLIVPIPKVKGTTSSDNYRAITLSSIMVKLLEAVILTKLDGLLDTSYLQYGYKKTISTTFCTFKAQEVISYYVEHDSSVICTLLDASKAFDRLNFCVLFTKLIERGLPLVIIRILIFVYIYIRIFMYNRMMLNLTFFMSQMVLSRAGFSRHSCLAYI